MLFLSSTKVYTDVILGLYPQDSIKMLKFIFLDVLGPASKVYHFS